MRYYGSKEKLVGFIENAVAKSELNHGSKFVDLFTGTTEVAKHFKRKGFTVIANDFLEFSYCFAKTYIELNEEPKFRLLEKGEGLKDIDAKYVIWYLNNLKPIKGFIYENYCPNNKGKRKYFSNENGQKIDAIRSKINEWKKKNTITELEYYYLLTSLLEGVNLVANVAGTYGAYLKHWDQRALKPLILIPPEIIPSKRKNQAFKENANDLVRKITADILYLDPPYNARQYASNYFLLELIAEGWFEVKPKIYGKTGMRPYEIQKSLFSQKSSALNTFRDLIDAAKAKYILLSYSNEGIISEDEIKKVLSENGDLTIFRRAHKRYRSINQTSKSPKHTEESIYFVETPSAKKRANKLDGATWLKHSFSLWKDIEKNSEEKKLEHPAMFPISLAERCIEIYTNGSGKNILDPFAGSGSTLIAGLMKGMNVYGFDISPEFKSLFNKRIKNDYKEKIKKEAAFQYNLHDAKTIKNYLKDDSMDLVVTSPPYWDILNAKRSADGKKGRNYTDKKSDIGNIDNYGLFMSKLTSVFNGVYQVLKPDGYCIVVVMDIRKKSDFYPFHADIINSFRHIGFSIEDIIIWDRQKEYNNCKPLGYPYKFIVNKIHEYILIFKKYG